MNFCDGPVIDAYLIEIMFIRSYSYISDILDKYTERKIVLKLLLYLYFRTKVLKFRKVILKFRNLLEK